MLGFIHCTCWVCGCKKTLEAVEATSVCCGVYFSSVPGGGFVLAALGGGGGGSGGGVEALLKDDSDTRVVHVYSVSENETESDGTIVITLKHSTK